MSVQWFFRFAERTHWSLLPLIMLILVGSGFWSLLTLTSGGYIRSVLTQQALVGTVLMFALLPAYLLAMAVFLRRRTEQEMAKLTNAPVAEVTSVMNVLGRVPKMSWLLVPMGILYGAGQNPWFVSWVLGDMSLSALDIGFGLGNCLVWFLVSILICWRMPISYRLSKLGAALPVDIYRLDRLTPMARIAIADLLMVAGAMSFMGLQSLDAEFRIGNYASGALVGIPAALLVFFWPLLGLRQNILRCKQERIATLRDSLEHVPREDVGALELAVAHLQRVSGFSSWPIDVELLTRVFAYVVIPPLAWIAAALVENFIDSL